MTQVPALYLTMPKLLQTALPHFTKAPTNNALYDYCLSVGFSLKSAQNFSRQLSNKCCVALLVQRLENRHTVLPGVYKIIPKEPIILARVRPNSAHVHDVRIIQVTTVTFLRTGVVIGPLGRPFVTT
jgi:hypothetical protein